MDCSFSIKYGVKMWHIVRRTKKALRQAQMRKYEVNFENVSYKSHFVIFDLPV